MNKNLIYLRRSTLTPEQNKHLRDFSLKFENLFSNGEIDLGHCDLIKHRIDYDTALKHKLGRIPPSMVDELREKLEQLLVSGVIRKSKTPWSSNYYYYLGKRTGN